MKMKLKRRLLAITLVMTCLLVSCASGTDNSLTKDDGDRIYTYDEATRELEAKLKQVSKTEVPSSLYIYDKDTTTKVLNDISTFEIPVEGRGQINIEIAAATELSSEAPNDLVSVWAENFNRSNVKVNDKTASVSVRRITSGETITYMTESDYRPDVYMPSFAGWMNILDAEGFTPITLSDRAAGNTAGLLMRPETYETFTQKYGKDAAIGEAVQASLDGVITLAMTNPFTSSTSLNQIAEILDYFDPGNPLSEKATNQFLEYQKTNPPMAYTTDTMQSWAMDGVVDAMVMEEQAYRNTPELKNYVYIPSGARHDHPVCTFSYVSEEKQEVARKFVEYCLSDEAQAIATKKGFNLHDDYVGTEPLSGEDYLAVQRTWKMTKDGGRPIIAIFVADISGSMNEDDKLEDLKESLTAASEYIRSDNYIGLVTYSHEVYINLKPELFDKKQHAYFFGAVNSMVASGGTATYNAVLVALDLLQQKAAEVPNAKLMLFVLSDGERERGYKLSEIYKIVEGMNLPVYSIGYSLSGYGRDELEGLSGINEGGELIVADPKDIANTLRNLFNVGL